MVMSPLPLRKKRQMAPWLDVRYRGSERRHCGDGRRLRPNRHVKHERSPSITFPAETMLETGMRFLFFQAAAAKYRLCSCFSRQCKGSRNIVLVATVDC